MGMAAPSVLYVHEKDRTPILGCFCNC